MASEVLHIFFDTTEVSGAPGSPKPGRIASPRLLQAAGKIDAHLYVVDLSITEFAQQRARHLEKHLSLLRRSAQALKAYVTVPEVSGPSGIELERTLRQEIEQEFAKLGVAIIPALELVRLEDILNLSTRRVAPFRDERDPRGFHDAVILLACLKYAQAANLTEIVFVSNDSDHVDEVVQRLGKEHGVACRLVTHTDIASEMMENLAAAQLKSFVDTVVDRTTGFMEQYRDMIEAYLQNHPPKIRDFFPPSPLFQPPLEVVALKTGRMAAIPTEVPKEGRESALTFYVNVIGEFVVEEYEFVEPPVADLEAKPGVVVEPPRGSLALTLGPVSVPVLQRAKRSRELSMIGKARAMFQGGQFVGRPTIESLEVRKQ